jgi:hypothetical protein
MAMRYVLKNTAGTGEMPFDSEEARSAYYDKNKQYWQDPNAGAATPTTRYSDPAPKTDDVSSYYAKIKDQTAMPDEARRQSLRADAERDVQTQLLAIQNASNVLIADERARQAKAAAQGKAQVSGVSRLSGLGGSTVASQRQKTQAEMAAENERRAVAVLEADTARQIAAARGTGLAAAEERFNREQALAADAQKTYGGYIERLASQTPKETALIEVGGVLYNPVTEETVLDTRVLKTNEPVYREVGGSLYEITKGADGKTVSTLVQAGKGGGTNSGVVGPIVFSDTNPATTRPTFEQVLDDAQNAAGMTFSSARRDELRRKYDAEELQTSPGTTGADSLKQQWLTRADVSPVVKQLIRGDIGIAQLSDTEQRKYGAQIEQARASGVIPLYSRPEANKLLNEVKSSARQDSNIKDFASTRTAFETARSNATKNTGAGDIVLMRMIAKITDPDTGVREEEFRTFASAQSILSQYGIKLTKQMWAGDRLTPEGRQALLGVAQERYDQALRAYDDSYNFYLEQVGGYGGTDKDFLPRVVAPAAPPSGAANGQTSSGITYKVIPN